MLKPSDSKSIVVFPHVTWDWIDSFTIAHNLDTHIGDLMSWFGGNESLAKDYWLKLIDNSLTACLPFGFVSVQVEWGWMVSLGYGSQVFAWFATLLENPLYTFSNFQAVADWFVASYESNPVYRVSFTSPLSGTAVEWYWSVEKRVCRYDGKVMSYVDYGVSCPDGYRTAKSEGGVDLTLYGCIKIDALGGGVSRFAGVGEGEMYDGDLADFGGASSSPVFWYQSPYTFVAIVIVVLFVIMAFKRF